MEKNCERKVYELLEECFNHNNNETFRARSGVFNHWSAHFTAIPTCTDNTVECSTNEICVDTSTGPICACMEGFERMADGTCQGM